MYYVMFKLYDPVLVIMLTDKEGESMHAYMHTRTHAHKHTYTHTNAHTQRHKIISEEPLYD